ncbi:Laccase-2 [Nymphon striatum]|nr:Laccase-2 [Nymphon striatum]
MFTCARGLVDLSSSNLVPGIKVHAESSSIFLIKLLEGLEEEEIIDRKESAEGRIPNLPHTDFSNRGNENIHMCDRECVEGVPPKICHYYFKVEDYQSFSRACYDCPFLKEDCSRPHCVHAAGVVRPLTVINRMLPGPKVQVCENDTVVVDVHNKMVNSESISIHWHGQHMLHNPFMDGVPMVTQCPILKFSKFRYNSHKKEDVPTVRFTASTPGTHFWHSHSGNHRGDGAAGIMVVRQPRSKDPHGDLYDYDLPEHQMVVQDWLLESTTDRFLRHHFSNGDNKPRTLIVNGKGAYRGWTHLNSNETFYSPYESFTVTKDQRYRFRVVNNGLMNCPVVISIDNHTILMIASDGNPFEPVEVDSFVSYAGERFDFILNATSQIGNYWIRLTGLLDGQNYNSSQLAILKYEGAAEEDPKESIDYEFMYRPGKQLNPLNSLSTEEKLAVTDLNNTRKLEDWVKKNPDHKFYLAYDFYDKNSNSFHDSKYYKIEDTKSKLYYPMINNISSTMPSSPILFQHDQINPEDICYDPEPLRACYGKDSFCECIHVLKVGLNSVVEVLLIDEGFKFNANHPFHLHGHNFKVIGMDIFGSTITRNEVMAMDKLGNISRNLENPIEKDTVTVPDGGFTIIKILADALSPSVSWRNRNESYISSSYKSLHAIGGGDDDRFKVNS